MDIALTARHPTVLTGVTNRPARNGGAYSKTNKLTNNNANTLRIDESLIFSKT